LELTLGDLVAGQELEVVVGLTFAAADMGESRVDVRVFDEGGVLDGASTQLCFPYTDSPDGGPRVMEVVRAVARLRAAKARQAAVAMNRACQFSEATRILEVVADQLAQDADADEPILGIVSALRADAIRYGVPMSELHRKSEYASSRSVSISRLARGQAVRRLSRKPYQQVDSGAWQPDSTKLDSGPYEPGS
jgi:hypothetical protein